MIKRIILILVLLGLAHNLSADTSKRYISLAPSTTEILFALGLDKEIAGVSSYCDYPQEAKSKQIVGNFSQPNIEKILSLKPDYVFCTGLEQAPVVEELKRRRLKVYVSDPKNIQELFSSIGEIGQITAREKAARDLIQGMERDIKEVSAKVGSIPINKRPRVFVEIWYNPLTTAGAGSFIDELISLAGGINIAHDTRRPFSIFSPEELIKRNPDCIIFAYMDNDKPGKRLREYLSWKQISAVRENRLYNDIDPNILLRPGPRLTKGLKEIHKRLYP